MGWNLQYFTVLVELWGHAMCKVCSNMKDDELDNTKYYRNGNGMNIEVQLPKSWPLPYGPMKPFHLLFRPLL